MRRLFIITFFICAAWTAKAQPIHSFTHYSRTNGLPSTIIQDMDQDAEGYIWLATRSGLCRFDGKFFRTFINTWMEQIEVDSFGQIWCLSADGRVMRFNPSTKKYSMVGGEARFRKLFKLPSGELFLDSSNDNEIKRVRFSSDGRSIVFSDYISVGKSNVNEIKEDQNGNIWTMTDGGLYKNNELVSRLPVYCGARKEETLYFGSSDGMLIEYSDDELRDIDTGIEGNINSITNITGTNRYLIGSIGSGVFELDLGEWMLRRVDTHETIVGPVQSLTDSNGNIWAWSENGSLEWYDRQTRSFVPFFNTDEQEGWSYEIGASAVFSDHQNNLWIGTTIGMLDKATFHNGGFQILTFSDDEENFSANNIRALFQERDGLIFASSRDGLVHILNRDLEQLHEFSTNRPTYTISQSRDGKMWFGTRGSGIYESPMLSIGNRMDFKTTQYQRSQEGFSLRSNDIYWLNTSQQDRIWIGSLDAGVSFIDITNGRRLFIDKGNGLMRPENAGDFIRCVEFSNDGRLFACGKPGFYLCLNPDDAPQDIHFSRIDEGETNDFQHIMFTRSGDMYVSSLGEGLIRIPNDKLGQPFTHENRESYTTSNGLLSDLALSSIEDQEGNIWVATYNGLSRLNPETGSIMLFTRKRIGANVVFNEGAPLMDQDGRLFFNTNLGVLYFNPAEISNNAFTPRLVIEGCKAENARIDLDKKVIRAPKGSNLGMTIMALDMTAPERIQYFYKLDGRDEDWIHLGNNNEFTIANLPAGKYTLRMRSSNSDGFAVDNETAISLIVRRQFGSKRWMNMLVIFISLISAFIVRIFSKRKRRSLEEMEREIDPYIPEDLGGNDLEFAKSLLAFLRQNLDNGNLEIADMADAMSMSRSAFFERCNALLGKTPLSLLLALRFEKAEKLLGEGGYTIAQISDMTGFNDPHYFSKAFKKQFGVSPSQYGKDKS